MKLKHLATVLASILLLISCGRSYIKSADVNVFNISIDQCKNYVDLKLSDLIEGCRLIPLETTDDCVLDQHLRVYSFANYIILQDSHGMYKFSREGRFIKKLLNFGRGPNDLPQSFTYFVNDKNNQIIFNDRSRDQELIVYDFEAERFLDPIKKSVPGWWGAFTVYNDSLILASLRPGVDTTSYELFLQNFKGQLVSNIKKGRKMLFGGTDNRELVQRLEVCIGNTDIYVNYTYDDTLFKYKLNKLIPYIIVSYNSSRTFLRREWPEEEVSRLQFPDVNNDEFMFIYELIFHRTETTSRGTRFIYTQNYFFLNKYNGSFSRVLTYTDNITGKVQGGSSTWNPERGSLIPVIMPGDKVYFLYDAYILKSNKLNDELIREMPNGTVNQLQEIRKNIKEMDNPVLLIGTLKKNIRIS